MSWLERVDAATAGPLTREDLERALEAFTRPRPPHRHLISSTAAKRHGSITICADCGAPVRVP